MKRNKPTRHAPPKMKPYGANDDPYDPRERDTGSTRIQMKKELEELLNESEA